MEYGSQRVRMRPLKEEDAPELTRLLNDLQVVRYLEDIVLPYTLEDARAYIFFARGMGSSGRDFAIEYEGRFAGCVTARYGQGVRCKSALIGYWLGQEYWGRGIAAQAIGQMTQFLFEKRKMERVWAQVCAANAASCRALEKAGFCREGILKNYFFIEGQLQDCYVYACLREKWEVRP